MIDGIHLSKSFGENLLFVDLCFHVPSRGIFSVCGPSGRGKTTLLRIIMGLEKPTTGHIQSPRPLVFAPVFPENRLLPGLTALENVTLPGGDQKEGAALLASLGLLANLHTRPGELSSGMKRRVALARALLYGGDVLVLDEPFSGLDDKTTVSASHLVVAFAKEKPVILVSHNLALVESISTTTLFL